MAWHHLLLIVIVGITFFTNLGGGRLMDRDEPRNAGCAMEMLHRNDWVTPTFNAELRTHKPVLAYWFMKAAYMMFGVSEFSARFFSALFGLGTVLMTYHIGRRLFNPAVAFWGAIATASSMWFGVASRIATPDAVLIFFATLPILIYVLAVFPAKRFDRDDIDEPRGSGGDAILPTRFRESGVHFPKVWWVAALMYAAMGFAILAKGPVGMVLPTAVLGMFLLLVRLPGGDPESREAEPSTDFTPQPSEASGASSPSASDARVGIRRRLLRMFRPFAPQHFLGTCWAMRPFTALAVALVIALPWYVLVHQATDGAFTRGFFLMHNLGRAVHAMEGHGGFNPLYYPLVTCLAFFPWSVFLGVMFHDGAKRLAVRKRQRDPWRLGYLLIFCWVLVYVGIFTIPNTKLPSYVTPMYPALGLIAAAYVFQVVKRRDLSLKAGPVIAYSIVALVGVAMTIALPVVALKTNVLPAGLAPLGALGAGPILFGVICLLLHRRGQRRAAVNVFAAAAVVMVTASLGFVTHHVDANYQQAHLMLQAIRDNTPPLNQPDAQAETGPLANATIMTFEVLEPSWVFYLRRPVDELKAPQEDSLIEGLAKPHGFAITLRDHYERLRQEGKLPEGVELLVQVPYFMRSHKPNLVLLGKRLSRADSP